MKILINTIVAIAFLMQLVAFVFGALICKRVDDGMGTILQFVHFVAYICSLLVVIIFGVIFNYRIKSLNNSFLIYLMLVVALLAAYIHVLQIVYMNDFILVSCILLMVDLYLIFHFFKAHNETRGGGNEMSIDGGA